MAVAIADPRPAIREIAVTYRAAATPKGEAVRHLYRFVHALGALDHAVRAEVLALLAIEVREQAPNA